MIVVQQYLGSNPPFQTTVQGDFSDRLIRIETILPDKGVVLVRKFEIKPGSTPITGTVTYITAPGRIEHFFTGDLTPGFLKEVLARFGVVFER